MLTVTILGEINCNIQFECVDSDIIDVTFVESYNECLEDCQDRKTCKWVSFDADTKSCEILENCINSRNEKCPRCISGQRECQKELPQKGLKCDAIGRCQVLQFFNIICGGTISF